MSFSAVSVKPTGVYYYRSDPSPSPNSPFCPGALRGENNEEETLQFKCNIISKVCFLNSQKWHLETVTKS